jgi:hypothetical protein
VLTYSDGMIHHVYINALVLLTPSLVSYIYIYIAKIKFFMSRSNLVDFEYVHEIMLFKLLNGSNLFFL